MRLDDLKLVKEHRKIYNKPMVVSESMIQRHALTQEIKRRLKAGEPPMTAEERAAFSPSSFNKVSLTFQGMTMVQRTSHAIEFHSNPIVIVNKGETMAEWLRKRFLYDIIHKAAHVIDKWHMTPFVRIDYNRTQYDIAVNYNVKQGKKSNIIYYVNDLTGLPDIGQIDIAWSVPEMPEDPETDTSDASEKHTIRISGVLFDPRAMTPETAALLTNWRSRFFEYRYIIDPGAPANTFYTNVKSLKTHHSPEV